MRYGVNQSIGNLHGTWGWKCGFSLLHWTGFDDSMGFATHGWWCSSSAPPVTVLIVEVFSHDLT